jgi:hypothetical protein
MAKPEQLFGQVQVFGRQNFAGNDAHDRAHAAQIDEQVGAKARFAGQLVGEIGVVRALELFAVARRHDRHQQALHVFGPQHVVTRHRLHLAVDAHDRAPNWSRRANRSL